MNNMNIVQLALVLLAGVHCQSALAECDTSIQEGAGRAALSQIFECLQNRIVELEKQKVIHAVPIGGVVAWWGNWSAETNRPTGYELCDGSPVYTQTSPILGQKKPNLQGKFIRGAEPSNVNVVASQKEGGTDKLTTLRTNGSALTADQMPRHGHGGSTRKDGLHKHQSSGKSASDDGGQSRDDHFALGDHKDVRTWPGIDINNKLSEHQHALMYEGKGKTHDHKLPIEENRPKYLELIYLIRVK